MDLHQSDCATVPPGGTVKWRSGGADRATGTLASGEWVHQVAQSDKPLSHIEPAQTAAQL